MNLITIVMPAYNVENYIAASIESVLNQSYTNWELIIVNDGSSDKTQSIINKYLSLDTRITLINQDNQGVSSARNVGIKNARGEFISFLDSDDCYHPDYIQLMSIPLNNEKIDFSICLFHEIYKNTIIAKSPENPINLFNNSFVDYLGKGDRFIIANMAVMYKLSNINKYQLRFHIGSSSAEDTEFLFKYAFLAPTAVLIPHTLYYYYVRKDSLSRQKYSYKMFFDETDAYLRTIDFIKTCTNTNKDKDKDKFISILNSRVIRSKNRIKIFPWKAIKNNNFTEASNFLELYEKKYNIPYKIPFSQIDNKYFWFKIVILTSKNRFLWNLSKKHKQQ